MTQRKLFVNVFNDDDGIRHQHAHRGADGHQRHKVDRVIHCLHQHEGDDDRDRHGDGDDERRSDLMQEQEQQRRCQQDPQTDTGPGIRHSRFNKFARVLVPV